MKLLPAESTNSTLFLATTVSRAPATATWAAVVYGGTLVPPQSEIAAKAVGPVAEAHAVAAAPATSAARRAAAMLAGGTAPRHAGASRRCTREERDAFSGRSPLATVGHLGFANRSRVARRIDKPGHQKATPEHPQEHGLAAQVLHRVCMTLLGARVPSFTLNGRAAARRGGLAQRRCAQVRPSLPPKSIRS